MNTANKPISDKKRYVLRLFELAKQDAQLGALMPIQAIRDAAAMPDLTLDKIAATFLDGYSARPALGQRTYEIVKNEQTNKSVRNYLPDYNTITFQELHNRIKAVSMAWRMHPTCQVQRDEFVCIMGFASVDYAIIDIACSYAKAVTVPLASNTAGADLGEIFSNVEPVVLATTIADLGLCVNHAMQQKSIKSILVFNYDNRVDTEDYNVGEALTEHYETGATVESQTTQETVVKGNGSVVETTTDTTTITRTDGIKRVVTETTVKTTNPDGSTSETVTTNTTYTQEPTDKYTITVNPDTTPPQLSVIFPSNGHVVPYGTPYLDVALTTDELSSCAYNEGTSNLNYGSMTPFNEVDSLLDSLSKFNKLCAK